MSNIITVEKLLAALIFVGGITLALFAWDAERAMGRLDHISNDLIETTTHVAEMSDTIAKMGNVVTDHEHRITVIEASSYPVKSGRH